MMGSQNGDVRLRFPRLNLVRAKAFSLTALVTYELNDERKALVAERFEGRDPSAPQIAPFGQIRYTSRSPAVAHLIRYSLFRDPDKEGEVDIFVEYRPAHGTQEQKRTLGVRENEFLDLAQQLGEPKSGLGRVRFVFAEEDANNLWFPLPVDLAGTSGGDVYEIRGVRGAKISTSSTDVEFSFILDRPESDHINLMVDTELVGPITATSPRSLLDRAVVISRKLVGSD